MRTNFRAEQLTDPHMKEAEKALRTCIHCGFCTATCPTYLVLGDERDGPRGRIVLMQNMLESGTPPTAETVKHLDQCLSCLGCKTACPSGVDYSALIEKSRGYIEENYQRPPGDRLFRSFIVFVLTRPKLFAAMARLGRVFAPIASRLPGKLGVMAGKAAAKNPSGLAPSTASRSGLKRGVQSTPGPVTTGEENRARVLLLPGCVQRVLAPQTDEAAERVLGRQGLRVEPLPQTGCCGALAYHMGKTAEGKKRARAIILAFEAEQAKGDVEAVMMTASGCSAFLKEYGRVFADEPEWTPRAQAFAARVKDFTELAQPAASPAASISYAPVIAYHPPCSLQHGQRIVGRGEALLKAAGFKLAAIPDAHLCCGSAGSYSLLHPDIANELRARKLAAIRSTGAGMVASANIGCLTHLSGELPTVHIAELLDWAGQFQDVPAPSPVNGGGA